MMIKTLSPSTLLFSFTMILSTFMIITSSNWPMIWMSMEVNMMSFIPLMLSSSKYSEFEASTKYFLVQSIGSALMLTSIFLFNTSTAANLSSLMFTFSMMLKMGMVPLHLWLPQILNTMTWPLILLISTWQKLGPMSVMSYMTFMWSYQMMTAMTLMNVFVGTTGGLTQTQMRPLMAYSSISHMGWMLSSMMISSNLMILYLILYSIVMISTITPMVYMEKHSTSKFNLTMTTPMHLTPMTTLNLLSLGGMPPMLGFIPKWLVISTLIKISPFLTMIIMLMSMVSLFFYLKIMMALSINSNKSMFSKISANFKPLFMYQTLIQTMMFMFLLYDK